MKIDDIIHMVSSSLSSQGVQPQVIRKVIEELKNVADEEKNDREPRAKKGQNQVVILLSDPFGKAKALGDLTGWAIQMEAEASPVVVLDRIKEAAKSFNATKRGNKNPVKSVQEVCEYVKGKHWKDESHPERKTKLLTREAVQIIPVAGKLEG